MLNFVVGPDNCASDLIKKTVHHMISFITVYRITGRREQKLQSISNSLGIGLVKFSHWGENCRQ